VDKRHISWLLALLLVLSIAVAGCGGKQDAAKSQQASQTIELKLHHHDPPNSLIGRYFTDWAKEVQTKTNGRVKVTIFPGSSLGSPKDAYNMVTSGICDIAWGFVGMHPGQFPMTEVIGLPMLGVKDTKAGSMALWELYQSTDYLKKEYQGVHVLAIHVHAPAPIGAKKKIEKAEDLQGMKLRSPGGPPMEFLKLLGGSPIGMPPVEIYEAIGKGVIDGWMIDPMGVDNYKLPEVTKFILDAKAYVAPFWIVMNKAKWDAMPDDLKKIMTELSGPAMIQKIASEIDAVDAKVAKQVEANKGTKYSLSAAESQRWQEMAKKVWDKWVSDMTAKGHPAKDVLAKTQELIKKHNK